MMIFELKMINHKMSQLVHTHRSLVLNERYKISIKWKDVIIKGTAIVEGGITCGQCVENKHSGIQYCWLPMCQNKSCC